MGYKIANIGHKIMKNSEIMAEELGVNCEKLRRTMRLARKMQKRGKKNGSLR